MDQASSFIGPGDTLIVATVRPMTQQLMNELRADILKVMPELRDVVVLCGISQMLAYRGDGAPVPPSEPGAVPAPDAPSPG